MNPRLITALANGRNAGEYGAYVVSLSFVEYLIASRGLGGMNEMLKVMGDTGNVDESFREVYGMTLAAAQAVWAQRFRQQYGSG